MDLFGSNGKEREMLKEKADNLTRCNDDDSWRWYPNPGPNSYLSVTTIVEHGSPVPQKLKNWFKKNSEKKIAETLKQTAEQGTRFHELAESHVSGIDVEVPESLQAHSKAFKIWVVENKVKPLFTEQTLVSDKYGYAGTADLIAEVNGVPCVVDYKTSEVFKRGHYGRQLAAYRMAAIEMELLPPDCGMICLQIGRNTARLFAGAYQQYESCERAFLTSLEAYGS